jgi:hypothetical protein
MNFYVPATKAITLWVHSNGKFYPVSNAPSGAYPITETEYNRFNYYVAQGNPLQWYANQRPYITKPWTQPIFTNSYVASDGSRIKASSEGIMYDDPAYRAMDGNISGGDGNFWTTDNSLTGWWRVDFPYKIALTKLTHYNRGGGDEYTPITGQYFTDETMTIPIGDSFSVEGAWTIVVTYDSPENPILTRGIYFKKTGGGVWGGIGEVVLEAASMTYEAGEGR